MLIDIAPEFTLRIDPSFVEHVAFYSPEKFGDVELILTGPLFSLRIKRDRGQVFFDAGTGEDAGFELEYVLEFVDAALTQDVFGAPPRPAELARGLARYLPALESLFCDPKARELLASFCKAKSAASIASIFARR